MSSDRRNHEPLPVFLISYNRGDMLLKSIKSIKNQNRKTRLIVHDNGSDDPKTLAVLKKLADQGVAVCRRGKINDPDDLINVNETITEYFLKHKPSSYAVSDCDVDLSVASRDAISVYEELLDANPQAQAVGPMLRIRDIPPSYPLYNRVMNRHILQFWGYEPIFGECSHGQVAFIPAPFDTTFAVHRAGSRFARFRHGLRVYEPYEALHLDWYLTDRDTGIYNKTSDPNISHWNNASEFSVHRGAKLEYNHYFTVRRRGRSLEVRRMDLTKKSGATSFMAGLIGPAWERVSDKIFRS